MAWEWAQVALLVVNLAWTTLCLGGYRPETMVVTSALTGALLVVHWLERSGSGATRSPGERRRADRATGFHPAGWLLLPFLVYAAANATWVTPVPWLGWLDWLGWAQTIAVFWVVLNGVRSVAARSALAGALVGLGCVAVVLAAYQRFANPGWLMMGRTQSAQFLGRSSGPFGIPNSLAALLLLLLPPMILLTLRRGVGAVQRVLGGYLAIVFVFGLVLTISRGAWLSLALGLAIWPVVVARGSVARRVGRAAAVVAVLGALGLALYFSVPAVRARFDGLGRDSGEITRPIMWRGAWQIFREHPAWGGGAGSYNVLFEKFRPARFQDEPRWAHNDYLNTLSDYGLAGFALFFGAWGVIAWGCVRGAKGGNPPSGDGSAGGWNRLPAGSHRSADAVRGAGLDDRAMTAALTVGLAAFALQLFVDFHFKIPALAMAFATVAALVVQRRWPSSGESGTRVSVGGKALAALVAVGVGGATVGWVQPLYRGEALRYAARQAIDQIPARRLPLAQWGPVLTAARAALMRAVALSPGNGTAWADLAYATVLLAHVEPARAVELGREAERAADQALARSTADPVFWVRRGVALDLQGRWNEAQRPFAEAVRLAPKRASIWFNDAFHLSIDRSEPERARAALDFCLRLDGGNPEAQTLARRLADRRRAP